MTNRNCLPFASTWVHIDSVYNAHFCSFCVVCWVLFVFVLCLVPTVVCVSVLSILDGPSVVSSVFFSSCYSSRAQSKHCLCSRYGFVLSTNIYSRSIINCYWQQTTNIVNMWKIKTIMYHRYLFYITIKFYYIFGAKKTVKYSVLTTCCFVWS